MGIDRDHCPNERAEHEEDINAREKVIVEPKLQRRKGKIKDEIEDKRQSDNSRDLFSPCHQKDLAKRNSDENIQK